MRSRQLGRPKSDQGSTRIAVAANYALESLDARRLLSAGTLDATFGTGGRVSDNTLPAVSALAVQADGKIVEVGTILGNFSVARFNANGTPDTSFGFQGRLVTDIGGTDNPTSVVIQADGKLVVAGRTGPNLATVRYLANGQLDGGFGNGGVVTTSIASGLTDDPKATIRPDGKIVLVTVPNTIAGSDKGFVTVRLNTDGTPDAGFGTGGMAMEDFGAFTSVGPTLAGVALQADGKILVEATQANAQSGTSIFLRRCNADGTIDPTPFAVPNKAPAATGAFNAVGIAVQSDGKILGVVNRNSNGYYLFRDNADGSADATFGTGGVVSRISFSNNIGAPEIISRGLLIQSDGKIVVGGQYVSGGANLLIGAGAFAASRFLTDGTSDSTFGFLGDAHPDAAGAFNFSDNGDIVALAQGPGGSTLLAGGKTQLDLARFTGDSTIGGAETPFTGTPATIPGTVEAENFDNGGEGFGYHTNNPQNFSGNLYRTSGITVENKSGGGYNVGFLHAGDSLNYSVNVAATGTYDFSARVADAGAGAAFHIEVDGIDVTGTLAVPDTGGYQAYQTVAKTGLSLTAGAHVVKLVFSSNNPNGFAGNFDSFAFSPSAAATNGSIAGAVYNDQNGNGTRDGGEAGLSGQFVYLDLQGVGHFVSGDPNTTSDVNGNYIFAGLAPQAYIVRIVLVPGPGFTTTPTQPSAAVFASQYYVPVSNGANVSGKDFGLYTTTA